MFRNILNVVFTVLQILFPIILQTDGPTMEICYKKYHNSFLDLLKHFGCLPSANSAEELLCLFPPDPVGNAALRRSCSKQQHIATAAIGLRSGFHVILL